MTSSTTNKFSPEVRGRAVQMVLEHESEHPSRWAAMVSIATKFGCLPHMLREWLQKVDRDSGRAPGVASDVAATWIWTADVLYIFVLCPLRLRHGKSSRPSTRPRRLAPG